MVQSLDQTVTESTREKVKNSTFFGIITDESMDIAVYKKLIIYLQLLVNGKNQVVFLENKEVKDGKSDTIYGIISRGPEEVGNSVGQGDWFGE